MTNLVTSDQNRERRQTRGVHDPDGSSSLLFSNSRLKEIDGRRSGILVDALRLGATGITFARVISGGHEVALEDPDCVTILVPTKGRLEMETGGAEYSFDRGSIVMVAAEKRRTRVIAPKDGPFVATTVLVPRYMVPALAGGGAGKPGRTTGRAAWNVQTAFARQMRQLLPDLADDLFRQEDQQFTPRARDEVIGLIKDLVSEGLGKEGPAVRPGSGISEFRRVSRACDIIRARSDEALSLTGLAAELEVSPRWLQLSFQSVEGTSPREYLQRVRLGRVRERLLSRDETDSVTSAAMDCGFLHLGRFSQAYRRAFGELPSETIRRRCGQRTQS